MKRRQYVCKICGFVLDEIEGCPPDIAPGTPWEDYPITWQCPDCMAVKSDFILLEE